MDPANSLRKNWLSFIDHHVQQLPERPAAYMLADSAGTILYIGHTQNLKKELTEHKQGRSELVCVHGRARHFVFMLTDTPRELWEKTLQWHERRFGSLPECNRQGSTTAPSMIDGL